MHRVLASLVVMAVGLSAADTSAQGDLSRGRDLAQSHRCLTCHTNGNDPDMAQAPYIAGQKIYYLSKQLTAFRDSAKAPPKSASTVAGRHHRLMGAESRVLTDSDIANLAEYFANMPCVPRQSGAPDIGTAPDEARRCTYCHGVTGVGPYGIAPDMGGQKKSYLVRQLKALRASALDQPSAPDHERFHRMVAPSVFDLTDQDIEGLADYYSRQSCLADRFR